MADLSLDQVLREIRTLKSSGGSVSDLTRDFFVGIVTPHIGSGNQEILDFAERDLGMELVQH